MNEEKLKQLVKLIQSYYDEKDITETEDFNPADYAGGNFDDAFYQGQLNGKIQLAKDIRKIMTA